MLDVCHAWLDHGDGSWALKDATLRVSLGDDVCLVGRNGSGKSTLLSALNGSLVAGRGEVSVDGVPIGADRASRLCAARAVGLVCQDPASRILGSTVEEDVAFGPRNLGLPLEEVDRRVHCALECVGLDGHGMQPTSQLSGGQAQRLSIASALAMEPRYLALDEVTSELDEGSAAAVRSLLLRKPFNGCGRVRATHDAEDIARASSVVLMEEGHVRWQGTPEGFFGSPSLVAAAGMEGSVVARWAANLVAQGLSLSLLADPSALARALGPVVARGAGACGAVSDGALAQGLVLSDVCVQAGSELVLNGLSLVVPRGAVTLLSGASGSGKTTCARVAAGLIEPDKGTATLDGTPVRAGSVGLAFQRPEDQALAPSVIEDVMMGPSLPPCDPAQAREQAEWALGAVGLDRTLWERPTWELSGGQRRRAALAAVVARPQGAYLLDEPTVGLDGPGRSAVRSLARTLAKAGAAVCVISHDVAGWLAVADRCALVASGRTVWEGPAWRAVDSGAFEQAGLALPLELAVAREAMSS